MDAVAASINGGMTTAYGLPQSTTNGASTYGTLDAPQYGEYLTNNPMPDGTPWGLRTASGSNPYKDCPDTGTTRKYEFTVKRDKLSPDGYLKDVIVINGQYPGPLIEANWGDWIQVTVHNEIESPAEGLAIHWHGFTQKETPWYDGVPAVQQCPIAPESSFTYRFRADLYGSSWYHSHYSAQYAGGLHGPIIIHGPKHVDYDIDLGPVFISDWFHKEYFQIVKDVMGTDAAKLSKVVPASDNQLINGKMNFNCSLVTDGTPCKNNAGLSKFKFKANKKHRLRLINASADNIQRFSIDGHTLTVIANDFVPIQPYDTTFVRLGVGQRTDVIVTAGGEESDMVYMRTVVPHCSLTLQPNGLAIVYYENADKNKLPTSQPQVDNTTLPCSNDPLELTVPVYPIAPSPVADTTQEINLNYTFNASGNFLWTMNKSTFRANYNNPLLLLASEGNTTYPYDPEWNVYNFGSNKTIRVVVNNLTPFTHPMHLHGHNMALLSVGPGKWDGTITRPSNPMRRDVQLLNGNSHLVWQIDADNPGVWPFHCHIVWHVSGGLYVNIMERPDDIRQMQIPDILRQTCTDWNTYSGKNVVDQIDAGL
ncbi:MAG: hypothetical protein M1829_004082 [Trizodia sp. TS-e1964]|nr:MAG: hypothetical protein M1829_004082 [Trizodia sp. TS-e1964]